ncbi:MAG: PAS domain S-box protein [Bacteroidales bacterium]|nr:PAS domain S-box protein [Bacteroidales bacterium]
MEDNSELFGEFRIKLKNGEYCWCECYLKTNFDLQGNKRILVAIHDISSKKETESRKNLDNLFESSPEAILITNPEYSISNCNQESIELFGFDKSELIGQNIQSLIFESSKEKGEIFFKMFKEINLLKNYELEFIKKNGETFVRCFIG